QAVEAQLLADPFQTGELLNELSSHIHYIQDALGADDQRLGNPFHLLQRTQEDPVKLGGLLAALPALPRGHKLHDAVIREDAEHNLHLRFEFILSERLEQDLFGVDMSQPGSPDRIIALWRDCPSDWLAFKARVAEQLRNWIRTHSCPFYQRPASDLASALNFRPSLSHLTGEQNDDVQNLSHK